MTPRERLLVLVAALHLLALGLPGPIWAQRDRAAFGDGFVAKLIRLAQEHPAETVAVSAGSTAGGAAIAALIRELNKRKKEKEGNSHG